MPRDRILEMLKSAEPELRAKVVQRVALSRGEARPDSDIDIMGELIQRRGQDWEYVYRHDYDQVLETFVWSTVRQSLSLLLAVVEAELARLDPHP